MAICTCNEFKTALLTLEDVKKRIQDADRLKACLTHLTISADGWYHLYRCRACGQYWQSTMWEWIDANQQGLINRIDEVLYPVPSIDPQAWITHPYSDPITDAKARSDIQRVEASLGPEIGPEKCRIDDCPRLHIGNSAFCRQHHIASLQQVHALPAWPESQ